MHMNNSHLLSSRAGWINAAKKIAIHTMQHKTEDEMQKAIQIRQDHEDARAKEEAKKRSREQEEAKAEARAQAAAAAEECKRAVAA